MGKKYSTKISINSKKKSGTSGSTSTSRTTKPKTDKNYKSFSSSKGKKPLSRIGKSSSNPNKFYTTGKWSGVKKAKSKASKAGKSFASSSATIKTRLSKALGGSKGKKRFARAAYIFGVFMFIFVVTSTLGGLVYMQSLTRDLPDPERPFENEKFKYETSIIYDRTGENELYRLFGDDNRDIIRLSEDQDLDEVVPPELIWAFLAAEDIDFYEHPGFDATGIARCGLRYLTSGVADCGGSTITQQVVKLAALEDNTRSIERKLRELVLALQLENTVNDKDKILLLYMNIAPEGGNIYGVKTAAKQYFDKDVMDLTLDEAVTLAAIPNDPSLLAPGRSYNPEVGEARLESRRQYIYNNLERYQDRINRDVLSVREARANRLGVELSEEERSPFLTSELIEESRNIDQEYANIREEIKAAHFVWFVRDLLQRRGYNNGEAFTQQEINTGGYRIYTTLDMNIHNTALDVVQNVAIGQYGVRYGNKNSALISMKPGTGEILAFVGSKCYDNSELANCNELADSDGSLFDPEVNILTSQQQPGSSIKPLVFYEAYKDGILAPGSQMADIPIEIGNYKPVNSDRRFVGVQSARWMLANSRNIPAISALVAVGPEKLAEMKAQIGYSTNVDPITYGPSAALGAQDVLPVDHANGFATFANGGSYVPYEAIMRIEDNDGNIIFDMFSDDPSKNYRPEPQQILDERAVYMVNDSTNPNSSIVRGLSPVKWADNRDMSGKTGTSENNRDNWFVHYSPDFVTVGWSGNNDNTPMARLAFGSTNAEPWVREFMQRVGDSEYFSARTPYTRPGGIGVGAICGDIEVNGETREVCEGGSDYIISGITPPVYVTKEVAEVCIDQENLLAREIDIATGNSIEKEFQYVRMPAESLQDDLDKYLTNRQGSNGAPTDQCNVNRSPNGNDPFALIYSPVAGNTYSGTLNVNIEGFSPTSNVTGMVIRIAGQEVQTVATSSFQGEVTIPADLISGTYDLVVTVSDSSGKSGSSTIAVSIDGIEPNLTLSAPADGGTKIVGTPVPISINYDSPLTGIQYCVEDEGGSIQCNGALEVGGTANATWTPANPGTYVIWARANSPVTFESAKSTITVTN